MTNHDVAVATPSNETNEQRLDRSLAEQLVDQAVLQPVGHLSVEVG